MLFRSVGVVTGQADGDAWRAHEGRIFSASGSVVKITVLPSEVGDLFATIHQRTAAASIDCDIAGRGALGVVLVRLGGSPSSHVTVIRDLRAAASARGGHLAVMSATAEVEREVGAFGPLGDAEPVMRAVKARFDPHRVLNVGVAPWS